MFQHVLDIVVATRKWQFTLSYLHDNIILSISQQEYVEHVRTVLQLSTDTEALIMVKKCLLFTDTMNYLRHITRPGNLEVESNTSDSPQDWKERHNMMELQFSF